MIRTIAATALLCATSTLALAEDNTTTPEETAAPAETVSREDGLSAWNRIHEVASHPRCANCHVGESDQPMWSGPSYGKARVHGMNIRAGESRIGVETILCSTCHLTSQANTNATPHTPPQVNAAWQLAPVEAHWFGQTSEAICAQLRDPARNGGRDAAGLADHLGHDVILHWAWNPGGGREPAPYSLEEHVSDIIAWGAAGMPCPQDQ